MQCGISNEPIIVTSFKYGIDVCGRRHNVYLDLVEQILFLERTLVTYAHKIYAIKSTEV